MAERMSKGVEIIDGPTPNGGVKAMVVYLNSKQEPIEKKLASYVRIVELDEKGDIITSTFGVVGTPRV